VKEKAAKVIFIFLWVIYIFKGNICKSNFSTEKSSKRESSQGNFYFFVSYLYFQRKHLQIKLLYRKKQQKRKQPR
jgi:hypothetical protein